LSRKDRFRFFFSLDPFACGGYGDTQFYTPIDLVSGMEIAGGRQFPDI
jgi:hypothetical protein